MRDDAVLGRALPLDRGLYLGNNTRKGHSYYGMRIVNRTQAFEWYTLNNPNQYFKVTPLYDAEYLKNGIRDT